MPDVTRLLDRMEQMGLIARVRDGDDRRYVTTRLAARGREIVDRLDAEICSIHRRHLGHMSDEALERLIDLLTAARSGTA